MDRSLRKVKKVVGIITDPHPEFVSLVNYPANQTPFKVVKFDPTHCEGNSRELAQRAASAVVEICSMTFSKKVFKTVDAVEKYMDANGYENFQVNDSGDYFVIPGRDEDDFEGDVETIAVTKGLKMSVGRLRPARKSETETSAAAVVAAKAAGDAERSTKSLYSVSRLGETLMSIAYILSDAEYEAEYEDDNSPVPAEIKAWLQAGAEIFKKMATEEIDELISWVSSEKATKAKKAADQEHAVTSPIDAKTTPVAQPGTAATAVKPTATAVVETPAVTAPVATAPVADPASTALSDQANVGGAGNAPTPAVVEEPVVAETAPVEPVAATEEPVVETKAASGGFDMAALAGMIGKTVADALQPVAKSLTALQETVTKSEGAIEALQAGTRQVKKSVEPDGATAPSTQAETEESVKAKKFAERQARNGFGI